MPGTFLIGSAHICWLTPHHKTALKPSEEAEDLAPSVFNGTWLGHKKADVGGFRSHIPLRASQRLLQQSTDQALHSQAHTEDCRALTRFISLYLFLSLTKSIGHNETHVITSMHSDNSPQMPTMVGEMLRFNNAALNDVKRLHRNKAEGQSCNHAFSIAI